MKFKKAVKKMQKGCHVYRPHWGNGTNLFADSSGNILKTACVPRGFEYWKPTIYDILADDWECEEYVSLVN